MFGAVVHLAEDAPGGKSPSASFQHRERLQVLPKGDADAMAAAKASGKAALQQLRRAKDSLWQKPSGTVKLPEMVADTDGNLGIRSTGADFDYTPAARCDSSTEPLLVRDHLSYVAVAPAQRAQVVIPDALTASHDWKTYWKPYLPPTLGDFFCFFFCYHVPNLFTIAFV